MLACAQTARPKLACVDLSFGAYAGYSFQIVELLQTEDLRRSADEWTSGMVGPRCQRDLGRAAGDESGMRRGRGQGGGWAQTCIARYSEA
jgi:hypothetical protein